MVRSTVTVMLPAWGRTSDKIANPPRSLELAISANKWRGWGGCGRRGGVEEGMGWGMGACSWYAYCGCNRACAAATFSARNNTALQVQVSKRAFYKLSRLLFSSGQQSVLAVCASNHTPPF